MSKPKWYGRALYIAVALALTFSLAGIAAPASVSADPGTTKWSKYTTPTESDEFILPGSDIMDYVVTGDDGDIIYAIGTWYDDDEREAVPMMWKSEDGGVTWDDITGDVQDADNLDDEFVEFTAVAAAPDDPDFVVVAGIADRETVTVGSNDGGGDFSQMGSVPDERDEVLSLAVSMEIDDVFQVAAGTDGGAIWRFESGGYWGGSWVETDGYPGWEDVNQVIDLEFSPNYDLDEAIVALAIADCTHPDYGDYDGYQIIGGIWNNRDAWNENAEFDNYPVTIENEGNIIRAMTELGFSNPFFLRWAGDLELPYDYNADSPADRVSVVALNGDQRNPSTGAQVNEGGYAFFVEDDYMCCEMLYAEDNPWVASVAYDGSVDMDGKALLGLAFSDEDWTSGDIADWYAGNLDSSCCDGVQVLMSEAVDVCCPDWDWAQKPPTGQFLAKVAYTPDGDKQYASTSGDGLLDENGSWSDESAFSVSETDGDCWNQIGLIDTDIDYLADVAVNAECGYVFLNSVNLDGDGQICECDSVWRSDDDGDTYMRVWSEELEGDPQGGVLGLAPEEEDEIETIYFADRGTNTIYYADNSGLCAWVDRDTGLDSIVDIAAADESTVYVLDDDADVVVSEIHARRWSSAKDSKVDDGHTIVVWGDHVLVGGADGKVGFSDDSVDSFSKLDDIGGGEVHVAFDSYYPDNDYVYAAVANGGSDNNIYRTTVDDASFEDMNAVPTECRATGAGSDSTLDAADVDFHGIVLSDADGNPATDADSGGILYASFVYEDNGTFYSGVARVLDPASEKCCGTLDWDYLIQGLADDVQFSTESSDLEICGCLSADTDATLWAIDNRPYYEDLDLSAPEFMTSDLGRVWTYEDCFAKAGPELLGVEDGGTVAADECLCTNAQFVLSWERQCNACEYQIQIARDEGFQDVVRSTSLGDFWTDTHCDIDTFEPAQPASPSVVIDTGMLEPATEYYWRVRSYYSETDEIVRSQWSDTWSFLVEASAEGGIKPSAPAAGDTGLPIEGAVFTWSEVPNADSYELTFMDSAGAEIDSVTVDAPATSYTYTGELEYNSAYQWQVKALSDGKVISESGTATFRTMAEPEPPIVVEEQAPPPAPELVIPEPTTPAWVWVVIGIGAVLVILVIVLIFRTRRV